MKNKIYKIFLVMILLLSLCVSVIAIDEQIEQYPYFGYNNDFTTESGFFTETLFTSNTYSRGLTDPAGFPVVGDLNNDDIKEILISDKNNLKIYHYDSNSDDNKLILIDGFNVGFEIEDIEIAYLNDPNFYEYAVVSGGKNIRFIKYNGTVMEEVGSGYSGVSSVSTITKPSCIIDDGNGYCVFSYTTIHNNRCRNYFVMIDETGTLSSTETTSESCYNERYYNSDKGVIANIDNYGDLEYIHSFYKWTGAQSRQMIEVVTFNSSGSYASFKTGGVNSGVAYPNGKPTNVLVANFDGLASNGLEMVVGYHKDADEFKIYMYTAGGALFDTYPEVVECDGVHMSNPIMGNFFEDTGRIDFAIMGYGYDDETEIDICTGSAQTGGIETEEYFIESDEVIITSSGVMNEKILATNQKTTNELDEIVVSEYIIEIDGTGGTLELELDEELVYQIGEPQSSYLFIDFKDAGRTDIIGLNDNALFFINDGYETRGVNKLEYDIDPCISQWEIGTQYEIKLTPFDYESDQVQARVIMDYGSSNEYDHNWSSLFDSGSSIIFYGGGSLNNTNYTTSSAILRIEARDTSNPENVYSKEFVYSIGLEGNVFGECITSGGAGTTIDDIEEQLAQQEATEELEERLIGALNKLPVVGGFLGSVFSMLLLWLILVIAVIIGTFKATHNDMLSGIIGIMVFFIGVVIAIVPLFWVLVFIILSFIIAVAVIMLKPRGA